MKSIQKWSLLIILLALTTSKSWAQVIPDQKVLAIEKIADYLKAEQHAQLKAGGEITTARLAQYFREKFSERFFYDYQSLDNRLATYNKIYSNQADHKNRAFDHLHKYADSTQWVLPFNYQNGEPVNAYALRHLARQHKMVDIALYYFNEGKDPKYIAYFVNQMQSLNAALESGHYE